VTPISQFFRTEKTGDLCWTLGLLGENCERVMTPVLLELMQQPLYLKKENVWLITHGMNVKTIQDVNELFAKAATNGSHKLILETPCAFKSQGQYINLPTPHLLIQNLVRRWNGCITECPIEDDDGEGEASITRGIKFADFSLRAKPYKLKGYPIPGCVGTLTIENHLRGFHKELVDALLLFAEYSGVGIKTSLGMGGIRHQIL